MKSSLRWLDQRLCIAPLFLVLAGFAGHALAEPLDQKDDRARIARERAQADSNFRQSEQACLKRFVVTPCIEQAQRARRGALSDLKRQEVLLDEELRKQRAADRLRKIQARPAHAQNIEITPEPSRVVTPTDIAASAQAAPSIAEDRSGSTGSVSDEQKAAEAERAAQAVRRVQAQREKEIAHQTRKAKIERRLDEKAKSSKPAAAGLPVPTAAGSSPATSTQK